jgi:two-component system, OmpR family, alkaline phosphatase synthesis response regulator PhoP
MTKVLIVEDEPLVARLYEKALTNDGYEVTTAIGGKDGIEKANSVPDLILLDIMMPEPNGMEVLQTLRRNPETFKIPIIVLTNLSGSHDAELAINKGATDYWVKKDVKPREMGKMVSEILNGNKTSTDSTAKSK